MQFARELSAPATTVDAISALLTACDQPFERSQLYSTVTESKFVNESLRRSEFRAIRQAALFDACETLLAQVTSGDPLNDFFLLRSDVTHIVYKVRLGSYGGGGARRRHRPPSEGSHSSPSDINTQTNGAAGLARAFILRLSHACSLHS
jgi:hypothetical protein